jgi:ABC-type spermidine/putrescine transport system permease subunit II
VAEALIALRHALFVPIAMLLLLPPIFGAGFGAGLFLRADAVVLIALSLGAPLACALRGRRAWQWGAAALLLIAAASGCGMLATGAPAARGAAIAGQACLAVPFLAAAGAARLCRPGALMRAAAEGGAGPVRAFALVLWPLIAPGLLLGAAVAYALSLLISVLAQREGADMLALSLAPALLAAPILLLAAARGNEGRGLPA